MSQSSRWDEAEDDFGEGSIPDNEPIFDDEPIFEIEPAARVKKRRRIPVWVWLIILIPAGLVAAVVVVVGAGVAFVLTGQEQPVTAADRTVLLDMEDLGVWIDDFEPDATREFVTKIRYLDGSFDIEYEYDDPDELAPYLNYTVTVEPKPSDAMISSESAWAGAKLGLSALAEATVSFEERNDLISWGDRSRFAIIKADGQPVGNMFLARKGQRVVLMILTGVYFDDSDSVSELLEGPLDALVAYRPD